MKNGWQKKQVGQILQLEYGKPLEEADRKPHGRYPVYGANGEKDRTDKFYFDKPSIIIGRKGSAGEVNLTEPKFWPLDVTYFVTFDDREHDLRFLYYLLTTLELPSLAKGVKPGINRNEVYSQPALVPPLAEQQRIVGILDQAFECIATAKANAEKNLQNARAIFESHLQSVFTQRDKGWVKNELRTLTTKVGSGATPRGGEKSYKPEGISLIRSLNVHDYGFSYRKLAFIDDDQADELSNVEVQHRDVLLNITGASVARCCIVPENVLPARVNQHVSIIRPIGDKLDADFLHYLLISKPYKDQLLQTGAEGGATRQAITKAQIQDFTVEYPKDLKEQKSIVAKLDSILAESQRLESLYQQKLTTLDALKKSLLHQAFSGELSAPSEQILQEAVA
jgi:type I restriction enzyme, S subunit